MDYKFKNIIANMCNRNTELSDSTFNKNNI